MGFIQTILNPIEVLFDRIFGGTIVGKIVSKVTEGISHISTMVSRIDHLVSSVRAEVTAWVNFKEDVKFKSRVINVPEAVQRTKDFVQELKDAYLAVINIVNDFKQQIAGSDPKAEAEQFAEDISEVDNLGASILKRLPKLAKGLEKLFGVLTIIVDAVVTWSDVIDSLQKVVDAITDVRKQIEQLDTIFLPQSNKRKTLRLANGDEIKIRLGKLHS